MRVAVFNAKSYDREFLTAANTKYNHELSFFHFNLTQDTAILARGYPAVSVFINNNLDRNLLKFLRELEIELIATRSAGFNHIDLVAAREFNLTVVRVPAYSPYAVAEHAVGLILSLNRKIHRAYNRVRDDNFSLEGLLGFDLHGSVVGIIGTGTIGLCFARIMNGFGCKLLAYDVRQNPACLELGVAYLPLNEVLTNADIVSLHCPLLPDTFHLINHETLQYLKPGATLINTSRGALIDTKAAIEGIKSGRIGYLGIDVYEQEEDLFFEDLSNTIIQDDVFQLLQSFPNVLITAHQAFFTRNALSNIADTTLANIREFEQTGKCQNIVMVGENK